MIVEIRCVGKDGDTPFAGVEETLSLRKKAEGMPWAFQRCQEVGER